MAWGKVRKWGLHMINGLIEQPRVTRRPSRRRRMLRLMLRFLLHVAVATFLAALLYVTPVALYILTDGTPIPAMQMWWGAFLSFLLVLYIGKTLYDTLFFDHYQRLPPPNLPRDGGGENEPCLPRKWRGENRIR